MKTNAIIALLIIVAQFTGCSRKSETNQAETATASVPKESSSATKTASPAATQIADTKPGHLEKEKVAPAKYASVAAEDFLWAADGGDLNEVQALIAAGADLNAKLDWHSPEMQISKVGGLNMPGLVEFHGVTPLHVACFGGRLNVVRFLIEKGANVNALDAEGRGPLDLALVRGQADVAAYLRTVGAKEVAAREKQQVQSKVQDPPQGGFHQWNNCSLTRGFDFTKERPDIKPEKPGDGMGTAIGFGKEWGGWDDDTVLFRNGMIGSCDALHVYVKEGTEAKCAQKYFRFEKGNWSEFTP
jgi:hypothetical protein